MYIYIFIIRAPPSSFASAWVPPAGLPYVVLRTTGLLHVLHVLWLRSPPWLALPTQYFVLRGCLWNVQYAVNRWRIVEIACGMCGSLWNVRYVVSSSEVFFNDPPVSCYSVVVACGMCGM